MPVSCQFDPKRHQSQTAWALGGERGSYVAGRSRFAAGGKVRSSDSTPASPIVARTRVAALSRGWFKAPRRRWRRRPSGHGGDSCAARRNRSTWRRRPRGSSPPRRRRPPACRQDVDQLGALVAVQLGRRRIGRELGMEGVDLALGDREIEALEEIGRRVGASPVRQPQPVPLADHRDPRPARSSVKKCSRPTPNTSAIRKSVGRVGNTRPRSIFDSIAGDRPVCRPSSHEAELLPEPQGAQLGPDPVLLQAAESVSETIPAPSFSRQEKDLRFVSRHENDFY